MLGPTPSPPSSCHPPDPFPIPSLPLIHHPMQTRSKYVILKPNLNYGPTTILPPIPKPCTITHTLQEPMWIKAMQKEYDALIRNGTWALVPPSPRQNIVANKWVFHIKQNLDGSIARYKVRLVAKGFHQQSGIDYHETFGLMINLITVHTVFRIALNHR